MTALEEFQDKLKERIKGDVGELLPDEVIKELICKVLSDEFTEPRTYKDTKYPYSEHRLPPKLIEYLEPRLNEIIPQMIKKYFAENPTKYDDLVEKYLGENIDKFLTNCLRRLFDSNFETFKYQLISDLNNGRS